MKCPVFLQNGDQVNRYWDEVENPATLTKVRQVPHVTWWQIGDKVSEIENVVMFDVVSDVECWHKNSGNVKL